MDTTTTALEAQIADLAQTIANQAQALADSKIPAGQRYAHLRRLANNVSTLQAWVGDDRKVG